MATLTLSGVIAIIKHVPHSFLFENGSIVVGKKAVVIGNLDEPRPMMKSLRVVTSGGQNYYTHKSNVKWLVKALKEREKKALNKKADKAEKASKKTKTKTVAKDTKTQTPGYAEARLAN